LLAVLAVALATEITLEQAAAAVLAVLEAL
jgi:hypothetical protein